MFHLLCKMPLPPILHNLPFPQSGLLDTTTYFIMMILQLKTPTVTCHFSLLCFLSWVVFVNLGNYCVYSLIYFCSPSFFLLFACPIIDIQYIMPINEWVSCVALLKPFTFSELSVHNYKLKALDKENPWYIKSLCYGLKMSPGIRETGKCGSRMWVGIGLWGTKDLIDAIKLRKYVMI